MCTPLQRTCPRRLREVAAVNTRVQINARKTSFSSLAPPSGSTPGKGASRGQEARDRWIKSHPEIAKKKASSRHRKACQDAEGGAIFDVVREKDAASTSLGKGSPDSQSGDSVSRDSLGGVYKKE